MSWRENQPRQRAQRRRFGNVPIIRHQDFGTFINVTARFDCKSLD
jgi:hypothetical protein